MRDVAGKTFRFSGRDFLAVQVCAGGVELVEKTTTALSMESFGTHMR